VNLRSRLENKSAVVADGHRFLHANAFKPLAAAFTLPDCRRRDQRDWRATEPRVRLATRGVAFLEDLSRRNFRYFEEQTNRETGLVLDRARTDGSPHDEHHRNVASIAATGFGLTACALHRNEKWVSPALARERVRATLRFFAERAPQERGWFYHWMDAATGQRVWDSEVSTIDTRS